MNNKEKWSYPVRFTLTEAGCVDEAVKELQDFLDSIKHLQTTRVKFNTKVGKESWVLVLGI